MDTTEKINKLEFLGKIAFSSRLPTPEDVRKTINIVCSDPSAKNIEYARSIASRIYLTDWYKPVAQE